MILRPKRVVGCVISAVLLIVIGIAVLGSALYFRWQRQQRLARLTGDAPAEILEVSLSSSKRRRSSRKYSTRVTSKFVVNGRTIETEWTKSGDVSEDFTVGRGAKVCYDPANPEDSEVFPLNYQRGN